MKLYEKIYMLRTEKNLSQGDLAEMLDVSRQSVSKWETGASVPDLDKLIKMKEIFGVSIDDFVCEDVIGDKKVIVSSAEKQEAVPQLEAEKTIVKEKSSKLVSIGATFRKLSPIFLIDCAVILFMLELLGEIQTTIPFSIPITFVLMGLICVVSKKRAWLWCLWILYFVMDLDFYFSIGEGGFIWKGFYFDWTRYVDTYGFSGLKYSVAWLIILMALMMITLFVYREYCFELTGYRKYAYGLGWLLVLVGLPLLIEGGIEFFRHKVEEPVWNYEILTANGSSFTSTSVYDYLHKLNTFFAFSLEWIQIVGICILLLLTVSLIRTHRKKKVSVPDEAA